MVEEMSPEEKRVERECVEWVFRLTGGELNDKPWLAKDSDGQEWHFRYSYDGAPEWAEEFSDRHSYAAEYSAKREGLYYHDRTFATVVRDCLWGLPPEEIADSENGTIWRRVADFVSSGETECPGAQAEEENADEPHVRPCPLCEAQEGEEHGYIYLGDGWCEVVYEQVGAPLSEKEREEIAVEAREVCREDFETLTELLDFANEMVRRSWAQPWTPEGRAEAALIVWENAAEPESDTE